MSINPMAKKIFFQYGGNKGMMHADSVLAEYLSYEIDVETEQKWNFEILEELKNKIKENKIVDFELNRFIKKSIELKCLLAINSIIDFFIKKIDVMDDYSKYLLAKTFLSFDFRKIEPSEVKFYKSAINIFFSKIDKEKLTIESGYKEKKIIPSYYSQADFLSDLSRLEKKMKTE